MKVCFPFSCVFIAHSSCVFSNFSRAIREIFAEMELVLVDVDELVSKYLMLSPWHGERERRRGMEVCAESNCDGKVQAVAFWARTVDFLGE